MTQPQSSCVDAPAEAHATDAAAADRDAVDRDAVDPEATDPAAAAAARSVAHRVAGGTAPSGPPPSPRQTWLAVLAHAPREALARGAALWHGQVFETLRAPETGLTMVRARIGNRGDRFNLGEASLTRCVLRHREASGAVRVGVGYVLGRDDERARWVASADALLQQAAWHDRLQAELIAPLAAATATRQAQALQRTAASRVQFFTLDPTVA